MSVVWEPGLGIGTTTDGGGFSGTLLRKVSPGGEPEQWAEVWRCGHAHRAEHVALLECAAVQAARLRQGRLNGLLAEAEALAGADLTIARRRDRARQLVLDAVQLGQDIG